MEHGNNVLIILLKEVDFLVQAGLWNPSLNKFKNPNHLILGLGIIQIMSINAPVTKPSGDVLWYTVGDENIQYPLTWDETGGRWVTLDNTNTKNGYHQFKF